MSIPTVSLNDCTLKKQGDGSGSYHIFYCKLTPLALTINFSIFRPHHRKTQPHSMTCHLPSHATKCCTYLIPLGKCIITMYHKYGETTGLRLFSSRRKYTVTNLLFFRHDGCSSIAETTLRLVLVV